MAVNYISDGDVLNYTPAAAVTSGALIPLNVGLAGVALTDIGAGATGALAVEGVFNLTKAAAADVVAVGDIIHESTATPGTVRVAGNADASANVIGTAVAASAAGATTVQVLLNR